MSTVAIAGNSCKSDTGPAQATSAQRGAGVAALTDDETALSDAGIDLEEHLDALEREIQADAGGSKLGARRRSTTRARSGQ